MQSTTVAESEPEVWQAALMELPAGFVLLDSAGRVVLYNREESRLASGRAGSPRGRDFFGEVAPCANVRELGGAFQRAMADGESLDADVEFRFRFPDGELDARVRMRRMDIGGHAYGLILIDDNTKLKETEKALEAALEEARQASLRDALTGLYNRRHFACQLILEVRRGHRSGQPLSLLMLDIDRLKEVNDRLGHQRGDAVLVAVAEALRKTLRASDVGFRWGGDEFCALLPDTERAAAETVAHRIQRALTEAEPELKSELGIGLSMGVVCTRFEEGTAKLPDETAQELGDGLIRRADEALYVAKRKGLDDIVIAT